MTKKASLYYRGISDVTKIGNKHELGMVPSAYRFENNVNFLDFESKIFNYVINNRDSFEFLRYRKFKGKTYKSIRLLSLMQHYGFPTRLLDLTLDNDVALYFASSDCFDKDGIVFTLDLSKNKTIRIIKGSDAKLIRYKLDYIEKKQCLGNELSSLKQKEPHIVSNISKNILIDYINAFGSSIDNKRCENQKGSFLLFGNEINNGIITDKLNIDDLQVEEKIIKKENKIMNLFELANKNISLKSIYPDSEKTIKVLTKMQKIGSLSKEDVEYISGIKEIKNIDEILTVINNEKYKKYFDVICVDYVNYLNSTNDFLKLNEIIRKVTNR